MKGYSVFEKHNDKKNEFSKGLYTSVWIPRLIYAAWRRQILKTRNLTRRLLCIYGLYKIVVASLSTKSIRDEGNLNGNECKFEILRLTRLECGLEKCQELVERCENLKWNMNY